VLPTSKLKKALPLITAIALSVVIWTLFPMWIVNVYKASYDFMTIIVGTLVCLILCGAPTWESIKAYREWRKSRNENKKSQC
jgi:cytochrome c biogenesis protein ResB